MPSDVGVPSDVHQISRHFDARAERYTQSAPWVNDELSLAPLGAAVDRIRPDTVVELGSGTGAVPRYLARSGRHVRVYVALDVSAKMLDRQPETAAAIQADAAHLPFLDQSIDMVIGRQVFHYFADPAQALGETRRVLTSQGRLVIFQIVPFDDAVDETWWREAVRRRQPLRANMATAEFLRSEVEAAGLVLERSQFIERRSSLQSWLNRYGLPSEARAGLVEHFNRAPQRVRERRAFVGGGEEIEYTVRWFAGTVAVRAASV